MAIEQLGSGPALPVPPPSLPAPTPGPTAPQPPSLPKVLPSGDIIGGGVPPSTKLEKIYTQDIDKRIVKPMQKDLENGVKGAGNYKEAHDAAEKYAKSAKTNPNDTPEKIARTHARRIREYHDKRFRAALGVDFKISDESFNVQQWMRISTERNVNLIRSLPQRQVDAFQKKMQADMLTRPFDQQLVLQRLHEVGQVTGYQARRIARDQTSKMNAELNRIRQQENGVTEYVWQSAMDNRVRMTHVMNHGHKFKWMEPPAATGHPGHDIQCRCVALPVIGKASVTPETGKMLRLAAKKWVNQLLASQVGDLVMHQLQTQIVGMLRAQGLSLAQVVRGRLGIDLNRILGTGSFTPADAAQIPWFTKQITGAVKRGFPGAGATVRREIEKGILGNLGHGVAEFVRKNTDPAKIKRLKQQVKGAVDYTLNDPDFLANTVDVIFDTAQLYSDLMHPGKRIARELLKHYGPMAGRWGSQKLGEKFGPIYQEKLIEYRRKHPKVLTPEQYNRKMGRRYARKPKGQRPDEPPITIIHKDPIPEPAGPPGDPTKTFGLDPDRNKQRLLGPGEKDKARLSGLEGQEGATAQWQRPERELARLLEERWTRDRWDQLYDGNQRRWHIPNDTNTGKPIMDVYDGEIDFDLHRYADWYKGDKLTASDFEAIEEGVRRNVAFKTLSEIKIPKGVKSSIFDVEGVPNHKLIMNAIDVENTANMTDMFKAIDYYGPKKLPKVLVKHDVSTGVTANIGGGMYIFGRRHINLDPAAFREGYSTLHYRKQAKVWGDESLSPIPHADYGSIGPSRTWIHEGMHAMLDPLHKSGRNQIEMVMPRADMRTTYGWYGDMTVKMDMFDVDSFGSKLARMHNEATREWYVRKEIADVIYLKHGLHTDDMGLPGAVWRNYEGWLRKSNYGTAEEYFSVNFDGYAGLKMSMAKQRERLLRGKVTKKEFDESHRTYKSTIALMRKRSPKVLEFCEELWDELGGHKGAWPDDMLTYVPKNLPEKMKPLKGFTTDEQVDYLRLLRMEADKNLAKGYAPIPNYMQDYTEKALRKRRNRQLILEYRTAPLWRLYEAQRSIGQTQEARATMMRAWKWANGGLDDKPPSKRWLYEFKLNAKKDFNSTVFSGPYKWMPGHRGYYRDLAARHWLVDERPPANFEKRFGDYDTKYKNHKYKKHMDDSLMDADDTKWLDTDGIEDDFLRRTAKKKQQDMDRNTKGSEGGLDDWLKAKPDAVEKGAPGDTVLNNYVRNSGPNRNKPRVVEGERFDSMKGISMQRGLGSEYLDTELAGKYTGVSPDGNGMYFGFNVGTSKGKLTGTTAAVDYAEGSEGVIGSSGWLYQAKLPASATVVSVPDLRKLYREYAERIGADETFGMDIGQFATIAGADGAYYYTNVGLLKNQGLQPVMAIYRMDKLLVDKRTLPDGDWAKKYGREGLADHLEQQGNHARGYKDQQLYAMRERSLETLRRNLDELVERGPERNRKAWSDIATGRNRRGSADAALNPVNRDMETYFEPWKPGRVRETPLDSQQARRQITAQEAVTRERETVAAARDLPAPERKRIEREAAERRRRREQSALRERKVTRPAPQPLPDPETIRIKRKWDQRMGEPRAGFAPSASLPAPVENRRLNNLLRNRDGNKPRVVAGKRFDRSRGPVIQREMRANDLPDELDGKIPKVLPSSINVKNVTAGQGALVRYGDDFGEIGQDAWLYQARLSDDAALIAMDRLERMYQEFAPRIGRSGQGLDIVEFAALAGIDAIYSATQAGRAGISVISASKLVVDERTLPGGEWGKLGRANVLRRIEAQPERRRFNLDADIQARTEDAASRARARLDAIISERTEDQIAKEIQRLTRGYGKNRKALIFAPEKRKTRRQFREAAEPPLEAEGLALTARPRDRDLAMYMAQAKRDDLLHMPARGMDGSLVSLLRRIDGNAPRKSSPNAVKWARADGMLLSRASTEDMIPLEVAGRAAYVHPAGNGLRFDTRIVRTDTHRPLVMTRTPDGGWLYQARLDPDAVVVSHKDVTRMYQEHGAALGLDPQSYADMGRFAAMLDVDAVYAFERIGTGPPVPRVNVLRASKLTVNTRTLPPTSGDIDRYRTVNTVRRYMADVEEGAQTVRDVDLYKMRERGLKVARERVTELRENAAKGVSQKLGKLRKRLLPPAPYFKALTEAERTVAMHGLVMNPAHAAVNLFDMTELPKGRKMSKGLKPKALATVSERGLIAGQDYVKTYGPRKLPALLARQGVNAVAAETAGYDRLRSTLHIRPAMAVDEIADAYVGAAVTALVEGSAVGEGLLDPSDVGRKLAELHRKTVLEYWTRIEASKSRGFDLDHVWKSTESASPAEYARINFREYVHGRMAVARAKYEQERGIASYPAYLRTRERFLGRVAAMRERSPATLAWAEEMWDQLGGQAAWTDTPGRTVRIAAAQGLSGAAGLSLKQSMEYVRLLKEETVRLPDSTPEGVDVRMRLAAVRKSMGDTTVAWTEIEALPDKPREQVSKAWQEQKDVVLGHVSAALPAPKAHLERLRAKHPAPEGAFARVGSEIETIKTKDVEIGPSHRFFIPGVGATYIKIEDPEDIGKSIAQWQMLTPAQKTQAEDWLIEQGEFTELPVAPPIDRSERGLMWALSDEEAALDVPMYSEGLGGDTAPEFIKQRKRLVEVQRQIRMYGPRKLSGVLAANGYRIGLMDHISPTTLGDATRDEIRLSMHLLDSEGHLTQVFLHEAMHGIEFAGRYDHKIAGWHQFLSPHLVGGDLALLHRRAIAEFYVRGAAVNAVSANSINQHAGAMVNIGATWRDYEGTRRAIRGQFHVQEYFTVNWENYALDRFNATRAQQYALTGEGTTDQLERAKETFLRTENRLREKSPHMLAFVEKLWEELDGPPKSAMHTLEITNRARVETEIKGAWGLTLDESMEYIRYLDRAASALAARGEWFKNTELYKLLVKREYLMAREMGLERRRIQIWTDVLPAEEHMDVAKRGAKKYMGEYTIDMNGDPWTIEGVKDHLKTLRERWKAEDTADLTRLRNVSEPAPKLQLPMVLENHPRPTGEVMRVAAPVEALKTETHEFSPVDLGLPPSHGIVEIEIVDPDEIGKALVQWQRLTPVEKDDAREWLMEQDEFVNITAAPDGPRVEHGLALDVHQNDLIRELPLYFGPGVDEYGQTAREWRERLTKVQKDIRVYGPRKLVPMLAMRRYKLGLLHSIADGVAGDASIGELRISMDRMASDIALLSTFLHEALHGFEFETRYMPGQNTTMWGQLLDPEEVGTDLSRLHAAAVAEFYVRGAAVYGKDPHGAALALSGLQGAGNAIVNIGATWREYEGVQRRINGAYFAQEYFTVNWQQYATARVDANRAHQMALTGEGTMDELEAAKESFHEVILKLNWKSPHMLAFLNALWDALDGPSLDAMSTMRILERADVKSRFKGAWGLSLEESMEYIRYLNREAWEIAEDFTTDTIHVFHALREREFLMARDMGLERRVDMDIVSSERMGSCGNAQRAEVSWARSKSAR